jgi:hypothetical protein
MNENTFGRSAAIPNPALRAFEVLVGKWTTTGSHPMLPGVTLHGETSFEWIEGGAFLVMRSRNEEKKIPTGIAIIATDNSLNQFYMLYFNEREVSRKYDVSFEKNVLKWWRSDPEFSQRFSLTIKDDRTTMIGKGEMSKDGTTWEPDLSLEYKRLG